MLVLSRKPAEGVRIGEHIVLSVVEIRGGRVRLGIEAPANVDIRRAEMVSKTATPARGERKLHKVTDAA